eukprot:jgi/Psemu1/289543/fgenesh1_pg.367_\
MNVKFFLSFFFAATASAADTSPSLRGLGSSGTTFTVDGLEINVSSNLTPGCSAAAPQPGDSCYTELEQCIYLVNQVSNGDVLVLPSYWVCTCDRDGQYHCIVNCIGSKCIDTKAPTPAPKGRVGDVTAPPNYSWCPDTHPGHSSTCGYPGMVCKYLEGTFLVDCECEMVKTQSSTSWTKVWRCLAEDGLESYGTGNFRLLSESEEADGP